MCLRCSTLIQKRVSGNILFSTVGTTFSVLMFQIFTDISHLILKIFASRTLNNEIILIKNLFPYKKNNIKNFETLYLSKQLGYTSTFE